ncbi:MAG: hypothetical protein ABEK36_05705 [Candidatus Aenigmatarchaeota archaeon]
MGDSKDVKDVLENYKESEIERGFSEKLKKRNEKVIKHSDTINNFQFLKSDKESYVFEGNDKLRCIINLKQKTKKLILEFFLEDEKKLEIYSKNIKNENGGYVAKIDIGPLYLDESRYNLAIRSENKKLIEGIEIGIKGDKKKFGDHILMKDPLNNGDFPDGKYFAFGNVKQVIEDFENGKSIYVYNDFIESEKIKKNYSKAKIINGEK